MSAAVLIVGLIAWGVVLYWIFAPMPDRDRHGGTLPRATFENFREPMRDEWGNPHSGVSDDELEALYAQPAREPRR